jgi:hypothetical protein
VVLLTGIILWSRRAGLLKASSSLCTTCSLGISIVTPGLISWTPRPSFRVEKNTKTVNRDERARYERQETGGFQSKELDEFGWHIS